MLGRKLDKKKKPENNDVRAHTSSVARGVLQEMLEERFNIYDTLCISDVTSRSLIM